MTMLIGDKEQKWLGMETLCSMYTAAEWANTRSLMAFKKGARALGAI